VHATVANTGQVPAVLTFVDRPIAALGEEGPTPPWLSAHFNLQPNPPPKVTKGPKITSPTYNLEPGDTCTITFTANVSTPAMARDLDDDVIRLDDVLILRVLNGRDHFLPVIGRWQRSSLDGIKKWTEEGVRKLQGQRVTDSVASSVRRGLFGSSGS